MRWKTTLAPETLELYLVWFLRVMACIYLLLGIWQWLVILGISHEGEFITFNLAKQAIIGFFAIVDLVAAVGLWMTSSWGAVVWLLAVLCDLVLHVFFPQLAVTSRFFVVFDLSAMLVYLWLATSLARQRAA